MRAVAGTAAIPAARCRNLRRGSFIAPPEAYTTVSVSTTLIYGIRRIKTDNIGGEADIGRASRSCRSVAIDPHVWSGRALQEDFDRDGGCAVLRQCIRPLIGALRAPGHHGYQRACDLVSGQASTGHVGHQGSHAPGRPILHLVSSPLADLGR